MFPTKSAIALAVIAALLAPVGAHAGEVSRGEKVAAVPANGRIPLDLEVGRLRFVELLVQKVSTDPAVTSARPAGEVVAPAVLAVTSHHGEDEADMHLTVTFLDAQGEPVLTCVNGADQDEQTLAETHAVCRAVRTTMAAWAKVTQVRFEAKVVED